MDVVPHECTRRTQKYGNNGPKNAALEMAYKTVPSGFNCFFREMIADVTKMNSYVNTRFYLRNTEDLFNYSLAL